MNVRMLALAMLVATSFLATPCCAETIASWTCEYERMVGNVMGMAGMRITTKLKYSVSVDDGVLTIVHTYDDIGRREKTTIPLNRIERVSEVYELTGRLSIGIEAFSTGEGFKTEVTGKSFPSDSMETHHNSGIEFCESDSATANRVHRRLVELVGR